LGSNCLMRIVSSPIKANQIPILIASKESLMPSF
jgi:hypothetical protein